MWFSQPAVHCLHQPRGSHGAAQQAFGWRFKRVSHVSCQCLRCIQSSAFPLRLLPGQRIALAQFCSILHHPDHRSLCNAPAPVCRSPHLMGRLWNGETMWQKETSPTTSRRQVLAFKCNQGSIRMQCPRRHCPHIKHEDAVAVAELTPIVCRKHIRACLPRSYVLRTMDHVHRLLSKGDLDHGSHVRGCSIKELRIPMANWMG